MKKNFLIFTILCVAISAAAQDFDDLFYNKTMRFDYIHAGNSTSEYYYFNRLKEEPFFAGSKVNLVDTNNYGNQLFKIIDKASGKVIYSRGFCTLFNEWQTTEEAAQTQKAFPESVVFPYPKKAARIELYARNEKMGFDKKFAYDIDPDSYFVEKLSLSYETFEVMYTGNPARRVDIVLIPEGYTASQRAKFEEACRFFADEFFKYSPFKENRNRFNIVAVWAPSRDEGVTIPGEHVWKRTATGANFYTFNSERYQTISNFQQLRDIAGHVAYDYIYVLSNTQKYGGGGIYNFYGISAAHHPSLTGKVYVHEFGHLFLGLGDEYVGGVSFNEMYPVNREPWEPNLTTLVDFDAKAWKKMLDPKIPVPTPVTKEYDGKLGVFEGGGYVTKGVYRPRQQCLMNQISLTDTFCPVCLKAINDMIDFLTR